MRKIGLIVLALTLILLSGCEMLPKSYERTVPKYSSVFLDCVADEFQAGTLGPCNKRVVADWIVMSGF